MERAADGRRRRALHWQMKKVAPGTRVMTEDKGASTEPLGGISKKTGARVERFATAPLTLEGTKERSGRRCNRGTQQEARDARQARLLRDADIGLDPYQEAVAADKRKRVLKSFDEGDTVSVFFPTLGESFSGVVSDKAKNRTLTVSFTPSVAGALLSPRLRFRPLMGDSGASRLRNRSGGRLWRGARAVPCTSELPFPLKSASC